MRYRRAVGRHDGLTPQSVKTRQTPDVERHPPPRDQPLQCPRCQHAYGQAYGQAWRCPSIRGDGGGLPESPITRAALHLKQLIQEVVSFPLGCTSPHLGELQGSQANVDPLARHYGYAGTDLMLPSCASSLPWPAPSMHSPGWRESAASASRRYKPMDQDTRGPREGHGWLVDKYPTTMQVREGFHGTVGVALQIPFRV